ncbi:prolyl-tRNA synthetase [Sporormia fimetaria CBS 119925]|uniref:proline--tRNA ligase n=1 Tax=Sporormia fimetaria CBS 119925 TaxID=1340428 RepID=A0A6A6V0G3_9PLEO|nr:prolyl-tRNA synthetase [Sporormia fimetaria CBS 119925]
MAARTWRAVRPLISRHASRWNCGHGRFIATDSRNRLSRFWTPTGLVEADLKAQDAQQKDAKPNAPKDHSYSFLARAGYLRQVQSGIFHLLPLGLRVQNKLEALIDKHMSSVAAAKVALSSISTEALWKKSGRYSANSELLRVKDRRDSGFLLAPTHEEEITAMVAASIKSYKDLPIRLYQIGRKYRDERRPRNGLLRAKEFVMKDLYTFDYTHENALETYEAVRSAYNNLFDELNIPYTVAQADSGNMGGKLSHEYHFIHHSGEDKIWSCDGCEYVANEELVQHKTEEKPSDHVMVYTAISADHKTRINIHVGMPGAKDQYNTFVWDQHLNPHAIRSAVEALEVELATGLEQDTLAHLVSNTTNTVNVYDIRLRSQLDSAEADKASHDLEAILPGDTCPKCEKGHLTPAPGIEVGHTFHLGTRYSKPLNAVVATPENAEKVAVHMGCHGIGVSRLIGAAAALLHDEKGLNWPRAIAPFEVILMAAPGVPEEEVAEVYDTLSGAGVDVVLDDRTGKSLGWKLKDADLIGYPVVAILGKAWKTERKVEVQCRRLGVKGELMAEYQDGLTKFLGRL